MRILVVEDEEVLGDSIVEALRFEAYAADLARDGESAELLAYENGYDLVILDWTIPPPTGIELLRSWRSDGNSTPVLMLTARDEVTDRVDALDSGADDYLSKPFALKELLARTRSLLRRKDKLLQTTLSAGDVEVDRPRRSTTVGGDAVELSPKEFAVLEYMMTNQDRVVTRTELIEHVWDDSFDSLSNAVDVTMYRLRKKIDRDNKKTLLHTERGVGYILKSQRQ